MGRGIFTGFVAGGMVSVLALSVASLMAPLPPSVQLAGLPQAPLAPDAPPSALPDSLPPRGDGGETGAGAPPAPMDAGPEMTAPAEDGVAPETAEVKGAGQPGLTGDGPDHGRGDSSDHGTDDGTLAELGDSGATAAPGAGPAARPGTVAPATEATGMAPGSASAPPAETAQGPAGVPEAIEVPAGSEFARRPEDAPMRSPEVMAPPQVAAAPATAPQVPMGGSEGSPILTETAPAARPESTLAAPEPVSGSGPVMAAAPAAPGAEEPIPVPPPGEVETPALAPVENPRLPGPAPVQLPQPALPRVLPPPATPGDGAAMFENAPGTQAAPESSAPEPALQAGAAPAPAVGEVAPAEADIPQPGFSNAPGVAVNRLPSISAPGEGTPDPDAPEAADLTPLTPEAASGPRRALQIFAADAVLTPDLPVMSVVLVDPGVAAGGVSTETLARLGLPVTIALDPTRAAAPAAADAYRAAGLEVAILAAALPAGAKPSDVEVALEDWHRQLPEAVAVVEPAAPQIQNNRVLAQQLVKALAADGLGLVTQDRGLNAAYQLAPSEGLGQALIWRVLDAGRESAPVIQRTLERAAFEAERDGSVVVMLTAWPDTVEALQQFALSRGQTLTLAPVSAVALRSPLVP
ncbi:divergent polysaccharide deacetylase family protein [Phaeovulum sp. W22_SRMD_FR3]|uniref:divergent polysaccharide deacetylase family protein n=1 Tax=Phaeovulum sp. W22_SRMD_FR3 TaxID=3240274 RepID=UPI003F986265